MKLILNTTMIGNNIIFSSRKPGQPTLLKNGIIKSTAETQGVSCHTMFEKISGVHQQYVLYMRMEEKW